MNYANIGAMVGAVVSSKLATLNECQTIYGLEDVYNMSEISMVDAHNQHLIKKSLANKDR